MTKEVGSISPSISNPKEPENENHIGDTPIEIDIDMDDNIFTVPTDEEVPADEEIPAPTITDAEVPTKIEMPELADDDFLAPIELNLDEDEISMNDVDNEIFEFDEVTQDISTESSEVPELNELEEFSLEPELDLAEDKLIHTPYDKKLVADEIGLDEESFNELFDDYIFEAKEISSLIRTAVDSNESNNWSKQALKLKMMNENMRITNLETELETLIQTQDRIIAQEASKKLSELILEIEA